MTLRRLFFVFTIIAIMTLLVQGGGYQIGQALSPVILEGTFITIWGDGSPGSDETRTAYYLSTGQNKMIELTIGEELLVSMGGPTALNRQTVIVQGTWLDAGSDFQVQWLTLYEGETPEPEGIYGPQPWVSILCKFSDYADEPNDLTYFRGMYSSAYPGLDHYWREQSYDLANLQGSGAYGWYVLPQPRAYYLPGGNFDWWTAAEDCTAAADPEVNFTPFVGINLMFNADLDCCAWGGGWYACLDGLCQTWRMTWEPPWGYENIGVIAHETGHGFGLPHSYWNPNAVYDNQWDVMSDVWSNGNRGGTHPVYGTMGQHTVSYHKDMLGWINESQMTTIGTGEKRTITLERLALPQNNGYLGARILVNDSPAHFLTVEARQLVGYDTWLPRQTGWNKAVVLHDIHIYDGMPARVIDIDGNGNTGDAGAIWLPGETYITSTLGIEVSVLSATETGFVISISNRFTPMNNVGIEGPDAGYVNEPIPFTANVSPSNASTPITYTWEATGLIPIVHVGDTEDDVEFSWVEAGTKAITVTASNEGGSVVDTHHINIEPIIPIVSISGPNSSTVGDTNVFTATVVPTDVIQPITYTWQATGQIPITHTDGLSDRTTYVWNDPGMQVITITATNEQGSSMDIFLLPIWMPPASLAVMGPVVGEEQDSYTFTASVTPITTTVPITYVWMADGQMPFTHTAGVVDTAAFDWDTPGIKNITVIASNDRGTVVDTHSIDIKPGIHTVTLAGPITGNVGEAEVFSATVVPTDVVQPITYVWQATGQIPITHTDGAADSATFGWDTPGVKTITVTASNAGGSVVDTHTIDIDPPIPIVSISGPTSGIAGEANSFTATVIPTGVVQPITFVWQATGQLPITRTGGLSDSMVYAWANPGTQVITVTASNDQGSSTDIFTLPIRMPPTQLEITGLDVGKVGETYIFTASVIPITTTVPITYVWTMDGQMLVTHIGGVMDTASFIWDSPGVYDVLLSATNAVGSVVGKWSIVIHVNIYLPLTLRH